MSLFINAHIVLGTKFYRCLDLAAYNGPQMGLTQVDNPMLDSMCLVVIHVLLLLIQLLNGLVQLPILVRKLIAYRKVLLDIAHITGKIE